MPEQPGTSPERPHLPGAEAYRTVGMYAVRGTVPDSDVIRTPVGEIPVGELSAMFYSQIAPLEYVPDVPPPETGNEVEVAIVGRRELEIDGQRIVLDSDTSLFAWNALMALRDVDGISRGDAFAIGMMRYDRGNTSARDAWHKGVKAVMRRLEKTTGEGLLTRSGSDTRHARYHVSPRLRLVDRRPAQETDPYYLEQALGSRLLALEAVQEIKIPYGPPKLDVLITSNRQAERDGAGAWVLSEHERYLLNLIRLAGRVPLLMPEVMACGLHANAADEKERTRSTRRAAESLNATVFGDEGLPTIIIDDTEPQLIRVARSITISDTRQLRTPTNMGGSDAGLVRPFRGRLHQYRQERLAEAGALTYPEPKTKTRAPQPAHTELGRKHAARAFLRGQIGLRDIYMISYRLGIEFPFLHGTVLPLADGRRTPYSDHSASAAKGEPLPLAVVGKALGITYSFSTRVFAHTIRRLEGTVTS
jgi:hypothetical protein